MIDGFSSLVHLQHLDVQTMKLTANNQFYECSTGGFSGATLPHLQHLTSLTARLSVENLQQLGELSCLQQLSFAVDGNVAIGPSHVPGLAFPASLTYLGIGSDTEAGVLSLVPTGLRGLWLERVADGPVEGPSSLLYCMSQLQHLTMLSVKCSSSLNWPAASSAYSALTASSNLADMRLYRCNLPKGVWPHVWSAARKQPHLARLTFSPADPNAVDMAVWGATDMYSLVS